MLRFAAAALIVLCTAAPAWATTYYVSKSGSDANSCATAQASDASAKLTIDAGIGCLAAGDTLIVQAGTYSDSVSCGGVTALVCMDTTGSSGMVITIIAETPCTGLATATPSCATILDANETIDECAIPTSTVSYWRIEGFKITECEKNGVILNASGDNFEIVGNWFYHIARVCTASAFGNTGIFSSRSNVLIEGNRFEEIGRLANGEDGCAETIVNLDHGIYLSEGANVDIRNNVFLAHTRGWAIQCFSSVESNVVSDSTIQNNTFSGANPFRNGHVIIHVDLTTVDIANNISSDPTGAFLRVYNSDTYTSVTVRNTLPFAVDDMIVNQSEVGYTPTGFTVSGTLADANPEFQGAGFELQETSPAIDAGLTLAAVTTDVNGTSRPQGDAYEIGAYEFTPSPPNPPVNRFRIRGLR